MQTALQQPKPKPSTRPYALFLKDFIDPVSPHPRPESVHTSVSEWLESVGSHREKRCRSDSHLNHGDDDLISRKKRRSVPEMAYTRDADGFVVPPTPPSIASRSEALGDTGSDAPSDISSRSSARSLVEDPDYRDLNLAGNNIYMRPLREELPEHIAGLVDHIRRDRDSPGPSLDQVSQDAELNELWMGAGEPKVEDYFRDTIFPKPGPSGILDRADRQPMAKHTVPNTGSKFKVSNPVPDMLYGYSRHGAFPQQKTQLNSMGREPRANNQGLIFPFFMIEFKGDGPTGVGSMWVATNQCLGGSASCVNIVERLNRQLRQCKSDAVCLINSAVFSIAMSGTEARLYISWNHNELDYYMANVQSFLLQDPEHYLKFRKYVRNIIDWGKDKRLDEIRNSLDTLLEEGRKRAAETAKSRPPPSVTSATSSGKKHKSSSSRRNSSRSNSVQEHSEDGDEPYWNWDETTGQWYHTNADGTIVWAPQDGQPPRAASSM